MKKNLLKVFVIFLIILNITTSKSLANDYSDLDKAHWAYKEIQSLSADNILVGYPDGTFKPDDPATRAEFATMVILALKQDKAQPIELFYFYDVPEGYWAYKMIQRACGFDLITGTPEKMFRPEDHIRKAEAISILIAAVNTESISEIQIKEALKVYTDANKIPEWAIVPVGKSEKLGMTAHNPLSYNLFEPDKKITRAEVAANLYNMREEAKVNPNYKLRPKKGQGIVIDNVTVDGTIATINKGALIPATLLTTVNSQNNELGDLFTSKTHKNLITKEGYLLIPENTGISGNVSAITPAKYFIRNSKMALDTKYINTFYNQRLSFLGSIDTKQPKEKGFAAFWRHIIKGRKLNIPEGKLIYVELSKPIMVDLTNTTIVE